MDRRHLCERWHRLGIPCPVPHAAAEDDDDDDDDDDVDEEENQLPIPLMLPEKQKQPRAANVDELEVLRAKATEVLRTPLAAIDLLEPSGVPTGGPGGGLIGSPPPSVPTPPFLPPMKGPSGGSTPERIGGGGSGPGVPGGPALPALLGAALATAAILFKAGPAPFRAAAVLGPFLLELAALESAFTALLGIEEGRFQDPRPEERAFEAELDPSGARPAESQVRRPARGFLVDLSQMFVPPLPGPADQDIPIQ